MSTKQGSLLWQAGQDALELVKNLLLATIIDGGLVSGIADADGDVAALSLVDRVLGGKTVCAAPVDILGGEDAWVDAAQNKLVLGGIAALVANRGEVDVEEDVLGEVGLARGNHHGGQVGSKLSVDRAALARGLIPSVAAIIRARECNGGDSSIVRSVAGRADGAREGNRQEQVRADIGASHGQLGRRAVPKLRGKHVDAIADRGDRERVDPVEVLAGAVVTVRRGVGRAAVVLAWAVAVLGLLVSRS